MRCHLRSLATLASRAARAPVPQLAAPAHPGTSRRASRWAAAAAATGLGCSVLAANSPADTSAGGRATHASVAAATAAEQPSLPARLLLSVARAASDAVADYASTLPPPAPLPVDRLRCARGDARGGRARGDRPPVVLVACGSFNPPTVAHVRMFDVAEAALRELGYEVLGGYLSPVADGYAKPGLASAADRVALCAAAAADAADAGAPLAVDGWEASSRAGPVRSLHVLQSVEARLAAAWRAGGSDGGAPPPPRAMLLCGEDVLASMARPGVWAEGHVAQILGAHGAVCVHRDGGGGGDGPAASTLLAPGGTLAAHAARVVLVRDGAGLATGVSSTAVRAEAAAGRPLRWLVPPRVEAEVRARRLYGCVDS